MFDVLEMDKVLGKLKRKQGVTVSEVTIALVAHAMQMRGLSINRMEDVIDDEHLRQIYDFSDDVDKNDLYRTGKVLGDNIEPIIRHIDCMLKEKLCLSFDKVFLDWSASYLDGKPTKSIRFGHTKDHRADRPQICYGLAMDGKTHLPCGLTVVPGNTVDVTHFELSFRQIKPFLERDCLIIFDNGGYSERNGKLVTGAGFDFLTRAQISKSNDTQIASATTEWELLNDDMCAHVYRGNLGYTKCIYFSVSKYAEKMESYRHKAERDYDEMEDMKAALNGKKKPRKKYRNSNVFVRTILRRDFPLDFKSREEAIEFAVRKQISGREGYFILMSNRKMTASQMLSEYRSRNGIEEGFRDIKHGIDIRPLRCRDDSSVKGRVLIAFLAYFVIQLAKVLAPGLRGRTGDTLVQNLTSFSVTLIRDGGKITERIYSNFNEVLRLIFEEIPCLLSFFPYGSRLGKTMKPAERSK